MSNYYAVACGAHVQVCNSREEACTTIAQRPGGHYRCFPTLEEAECYVGLRTKGTRKERSQVLAIPSTTIVRIENVETSRGTTCSTTMTLSDGNWRTFTTTGPPGVTNPTVVTFMALDEVLAGSSGHLTIICRDKTVNYVLGQWMSGRSLPVSSHSAMVNRVLEALNERGCKFESTSPTIRHRGKCDRGY